VRVNLVDLIVGVWTTIAIIGVGVSAWATTDSVIDRRTLRRSGINSSLLMVTTVNLRSAQASLLLHAFFLYLGGRAALGPPIPPTTDFIFVAIGYILVAATNVRAVGVNQLDRLRLRRS